MAVPVQVSQYITSESARQSAPREPMIRAYSVAIVYDWPLSEGFILDLGACFGFTWYRTTPVTFDSGGHSLNASVIPTAMPRLIENAPERCEFFAWFAWVKAFLDIHPFPDGNGRIASLLFNWGMGTLDEPFPLPYYKF